MCHCMALFLRCQLCDEVVFEGLGDADLIELAYMEGGGVGDDDFVVDVGAVVFGAGNVVGAFVTVDDDAVGVADASLVFGKGDLFLDGHELADTALLFILANGVAEFLGGCVLFGRIGKAAHAVELSLANKLLEFFKLGFRLTGVADDESGADAYIGELGAKCVQEVERTFAVDATLHGGQNTAVDVLEGDVDVVADIFVATDYIDGISGE